MQWKTIIAIICNLCLHGNILQQTPNFRLRRENTAFWTLVGWGLLPHVKASKMLDILGIAIKVIVSKAPLLNNPISFCLCSWPCSLGIIRAQTLSTLPPSTADGSGPFTPATTEQALLLFVQSMVHCAWFNNTLQPWTIVNPNSLHFLPVWGSSVHTGFLGSEPSLSLLFWTTSLMSSLTGSLPSCTHACLQSTEALQGNLLFVERTLCFSVCSAISWF